MDIEAQTLDYEPDNMEAEAGISNFNKFGPVNTLETLSGGDILKYEDVKGLPYDTVYVKLLLNKAKSEYEKEYRRIVMKPKE